MSKSEDRNEIPRSIRHKQILDEASEKPDATLGEIASVISGVELDLVEKVLDDYGDSAEDLTEAASEPAGRSQAGENVVPDPDELTEKQLEILRAIYEHPHATQRELAEILEIAAPTACNRANSISGFMWERRKEFADAVLWKELSASTEGPLNVASTHSDSDEQTRIEKLTERVSALEDKIEAVTEADQSCAVIRDSELALKVVHASIKSDTIPEDEELRILNLLVG